MTRWLAGLLVAAAVGGCGGSDGSSGSGGSAGASPDAGTPDAPTTGGESAGGSSGAGATGGSGSGAGGTGAGTACAELEPEPNDTHDQAVDRGTVDDCDGSSVTMTGTLAGSGDLDVWRLEGQDTLGCSVNPAASSSDVARLCMFADCGSGTSVDCASGFASSSDGLAGCCVLTPGGLELELGCPGASDDATMWITVEADPGVPVSDPDCYDYQVDAHY